MKQGTIKDIKPIGSYLNPHTNKENYKFDVYFDNSDCGQFRTEEKKQDRYKVGQKINYKIEKKGFNGGSWFKLIDLSKAEFKPTNSYYKANNNSNYKALDLVALAQQNSIKILQNEIHSTPIDDIKKSDLISKISELTEYLYNDIRKIAKL